MIRTHDWIWTSSLALTACAGTNSHRDASSTSDVVRAAEWSRCCQADLALPGVMSRGSGTSLQCLCPAGAICNFALCFRVDAANQDAGLDVGALDDAGFGEAGPMDDAALDALVVDDALVLEDVASP